MWPTGFKWLILPQEIHTHVQKETSEKVVYCSMVYYSKKVTIPILFICTEMDKIWLFHFMECFTVDKVNELDLHVSIWINIRNIIENEKASCKIICIHGIMPFTYILKV